MSVENDISPTAGLMQFLQIAQNWQTPSGAPVPPPNGAPAIAMGPGTFDIGPANATTQTSAAYLSAMQGQFNNNLTFAQAIFNRANASVGVTSGNAMAITNSIMPQILSNQRYAIKKGSKKGLFSKIFG